MEEYLNGSAQTGAKILDDWNNFHFGLKLSEANSEQYFWKYFNQYGYINLIISNNGNISEFSLIDTENNSPHPFNRPLGLYNDSSLQEVFLRVHTDKTH